MSVTSLQSLQSGQFPKTDYDSNDEDDDEDDKDEDADIIPPTTTTGKRTREEIDISSVWSALTQEDLPQQKKSILCQHCKKKVRYQRKVARARAHLMKCPAFILLVNSIDKSDQPTWYLQEKSKNQNAGYSTPHAGSANQPTGSDVQLTQTSMKKYLIPNTSKEDLKRIIECIAMHYYCTGTSFYRIEEPHLLKAFKIARPDIKLPCRKTLGGKLF